MDDCVGLISEEAQGSGPTRKRCHLHVGQWRPSVLEFAGGPSTHNTPYRGGKDTCTKAASRADVVRWPGKIKPAVTDTPIRQLIFLPTLVTFAGGQVPSGTDGVNIAPLLRAQETRHAQALLALPPLQQPGRPPRRCRPRRRLEICHLLRHGRDATLQPERRRCRNQESRRAGIAPRRPAKEAARRLAHGDRRPAKHPTRLRPGAFKQLVDFDPSALLRSTAPRWRKTCSPGGPS
jgi:hypothetical protein